MRFKPAMAAVASAPLILLLLLAGGVRGIAYFMQGASGENEAKLLSQAGRLTNGDIPYAPTFKPADPKTQTAVRKVAGGQVDAIRKHDYKAALRFALPGFQKGWKPEGFQKMIETNYGELAAAKTVSLQAVRIGQDGTVAVVPVVVRDARNQETRFLYILNRDAAPRNGKSDAAKSVWHVSGCQRDSPAPPPRSLHEV